MLENLVLCDSLHARVTASSFCDQMHGMISLTCMKLNRRGRSESRQIKVLTKRGRKQLFIRALLFAILFRQNFYPIGTVMTRQRTRSSSQGKLYFDRENLVKLNILRFRCDDWHSEEIWLFRTLSNSAYYRFAVLETDWNSIWTVAALESEARDEALKFYDVALELTTKFAIGDGTSVVL